MNKEFKIFLVAFCLSLPFWWGINSLEKSLEDLFFFSQIVYDPYLLTARINQDFVRRVEEIKPRRNPQAEDLNIEAKSATSVLFNLSGKEKILFQKDTEKQLPIASLTKLMTALIVLENYSFSQEVEISKNAVDQESEFGNLKIGEKFYVRDLLYPLLIESSNDAAYALAELNGVDRFVDLMNIMAINIRLGHTYFLNPTGLDPEKPEELANFSTARDLSTLAEYIFTEKPLIFEILSIPRLNLYSPEGVLHHELLNTNEFLEKRPTLWSSQIVGGKTGWTPMAQGCLILILRSPLADEYLINIILGSNDRFEEMEKMVNWIYSAYKW